MPVGAPLGLPVQLPHPAGLMVNMAAAIFLAAGKFLESTTRESPLRVLWIPCGTASLTALFRSLIAEGDRWATLRPLS